MCLVPESPIFAELLARISTPSRVWQRNQTWKCLSCQEPCQPVACLFSCFEIATVAQTSKPGCDFINLPRRECYKVQFRKFKTTQIFKQRFLFMNASVTTEKRSKICHFKAFAHSPNDCLGTAVANHVHVTRRVRPNVGDNKSSRHTWSTMRPA